jgi:L-fuculose-phosphate aldolase
MSPKQQLVYYANKVYENGYVKAFDGNLSLRLNNNSILITASSKNKGEIKADDILEIDLNGKLIKGKGKISTEVKMHLYSYLKRKDVNAVVHCHPIFISSFAVAGKEINTKILPELFLTFGKIPLCKYSTPSTEEVPISLEPFIKNYNAFILQNHGALTFGKDIREAYYRMEKFEQAAEIYYRAEMLGKAKTISEKNIKKLLNISEITYGIKINKKNI